MILYLNKKYKIIFINLTEKRNVYIRLHNNNIDSTEIETSLIQQIASRQLSHFLFCAHAGVVLISLAIGDVENLRKEFQCF